MYPAFLNFGERQASMRKKTGQINSTDVARAAGTSQATVSRVFSNPRLVSKATREKVLRVAKELGYEQEAAAFIEPGKGSDLIGVIVKDFQNPFYTAFVNQISQRLNRIGKQIILFDGNAMRSIDELLRQAVSFRLGGLIIASTSLSEQLSAKKMTARMPLVLINRQEAISHCCSLASDDIQSSRLVADHFIEKGYRSFAFISGPEDMQSSRNRQKGYVNRLAEWGFYNVKIAKGDYRYESGYQAMKQLLDEPAGSPTAILCANDLMGLGAIDAIREAPDIRIPDDDALIGFDDIAESAWHCYGLSSMALPVSRMIDTAFEYISKYYTDAPRCEGKHLYLCALQERRSG